MICDGTKASNTEHLLVWARLTVCLCKPIYHSLPVASLIALHSLTRDSQKWQVNELLPRQHAVPGRDRVQPCHLRLCLHFSCTSRTAAFLRACRCIHLTRNRPRDYLKHVFNINRVLLRFFLDQLALRIHALRSARRCDATASFATVSCPVLATLTILCVGLVPQVLVFL